MDGRCIAKIVCWVTLALASGCHAATGAAAPTGSWIWSSNVSAARNAHSYFRRAFRLDAVPTAATVRIAADSRYILFVNGVLVGRGAPRSFARYLYFDTWDVRAPLHAGANAIAVHVLHYGETTGQYELGRPGLLCDVAIQMPRSQMTLRTDDSWNSFASPAWASNTDRMASSLGFPDVYDARLDPAGWETPEFDDSGWTAATVIGAAGMAPWTSLTPSDIPHQSVTNLLPQAVVDSTLDQPPPDSGKVDFDRVYHDTRRTAVGYASTNLYAPSARNVTLTLGSNEACILWLNGAYIYSRWQGGVFATAEDSVTLRLDEGWNRLLVKSAKFAQRWAFYYALTGPGAAGVVVSSESNPGQPYTWRLSPPLAVPDGKWRTGYYTPYPCETQDDLGDWTLITAPPAPFDNISTRMRYCVRTRPATPPVINAGSLTQGEASAAFQTTPAGSGSVLLDMGREVSGRTRITVADARGGETIDIGYGEVTEFPDGSIVCPRVAVGILNPERDGVRYADRYICRPGRNDFTSFEKHGFRYLLLQVYNAPSPVTVTNVSIDQETYPVQETGWFECSDERLNRIWQMERYTLQLNMEDAFTDCPWRERNQWVGDAAVEAPGAMYAFGDAALFRKLIVQGAQSQTSDGMVRAFFPTGWDNSATRVPTYALMWVQSVWDYYALTGDSSLLYDSLHTIDRLFAYLDSHLDPDLGLLTDVPDWVFVDWAPGLYEQTSGVSGPLNCLYYQALRSAARIALTLQDVVRATGYARRAARLGAAVNANLWDSDRGLYWNTLSRTAPDGAISQQMNTLAIVSGVAPVEAAAGICDRMLNDPSIVTIQSPFMAKFLMDALHLAGRHTEALAEMRTRWGKLIDWTATTGWEGPNPGGSMCHGWSAAPVSDLPSQYLGVRLRSPGWADWEMSPNFADLRYARGTVPTPHGVIEASWSKDTAGVQVSVTVPTGTVGHVSIPVAGLENATWTVNGGSVLPAGVTYDKAPDARTVLIRVPGVYTIQAAVDPG